VPLRLEPVRSVLQRQVDAGRLPGFVAAVRRGGATEVLTGGTGTSAWADPRRESSPSC
jgi:hypothetical protein